MRNFRAKNPELEHSAEEDAIVFPLFGQSAGVMEWWSGGVMKRPIQGEI
jgi:hypothetical protein